MIDDGPEESRRARLKQLELEYNENQRFLLKLMATGKFIAGDLTALQNLLHVSPLLADRLLTSFIVKALRHDPDVDYHLVLKKNPAKQGKGKTLADAGRQRQEAGRLMASMILNGAYEPRRKTDMIGKTASEQSVSQTKLNRIWSDLSTHPFWKELIDGHCKADEAIVRYLHQRAEGFADGS